MSYLDQFLCLSIAKSSAQLYYNNLKNLAGGKLESLDFLQDYDAVVLKLKPYMEATKKSILTSIVVALKHFPHEIDANVCDQYKTLMMDLASKATSNAKSEKQIKNWITYDDLMQSVQLYQQKFVQYPHWLQVHFEYVVLSLYTQLPPRRNCDYQFCVIATEIPEVADCNGKNVYCLTNSTFYFGNYKTARTYNVQVVQISSLLADTLSNYIEKTKSYRVEPVSSLLINGIGEPLTEKPRNAITRVLNKVFWPKKIGCSMIRNIYLTNKYGGMTKSMSNDATAMGTSVDVIQSTYIKTA
jgi:hypothetical protein